MKRKSLLFPLIAITWIIATITYCANAAGPATNVVTLHWTGPTNSEVPFVYEVHQSLLVTNGPWVVIAANIPSAQTNLTLNIDRDTKFWKVRCVNATNSAWFSDFSNTASTLWPGQGGNLGIRLGL